MKQVGEQQGSLPELDDHTLVDYLQRNPDFFIRNAQQVEMLQVPHPIRGTVSLVEWHLARQRNRIKALEENIDQLLSQAKTNEALFCRLLQLQGNLASASSLQDMLDRLHRWARQIGLAGASVRLFTDRWRIGAPSGFTHLGLNRQSFEHLRIQRLGEQRHYLGSLNGPELLLLLPQAKAVGSVAISLMGHSADLGTIIFSSRDPQHYYQGQGTRLLDELALMLPDLLDRWVERL